MKLNTISQVAFLTALAWLSAAPAAYASNKAAAAPDPKLQVSDDNASGSYLSGQFSRAHGDIADAIRYLRSVHNTSPKDMDIAIQLQGMLLLQGEFEEALDLADEIRNSGVADPLADLFLVLDEITHDDWNEASALLDTGGEEGSTQLWVPLIAGWVDVSRHKLTKPLTVEQLGVDVGRALPLVNYHLALINSQAGFKDAAAKNFKEMIEDPRNPPDRLIKVLLKFYDQNGNPEILTPIVREYSLAHPDAEHESRAPVIATPRDGVAEILYTMGGIMYGAGVINDAAIYLQLAAYVKPDMDEAVVALGDAYSELRQFDRSNATYAKITPQSSLFAKAQLHIALNYERMDNLPEALKRLDVMSKAAPDAPGILVTKGDLLRIHSRFAEAVSAYNEALRRMPNQGSDAWAIYFARASCLDRLGKWPEARKDLEQALVLKPDQPDVLNYLGFARLEHGETLTEAQEMISKAVKARPNDAQIVDSMGWVLYMQGQYAASAPYLEKAVELLPSDPEVNDHLGDLYWRLGRKTEARFQWERSLSFTPESKLAAVIHKKLKDGLPPATTLAGSVPTVTATP